MKQLEWIDDGYCDCLTVGGGTIVFRPMLWHERSELWRVSRTADTLVAAINSRIVCGPKWGDLPEDCQQAVFNAVCRPGSRQHLVDEANLRTGVRIAMLYPHLSTTSCEYCRKFWFDPETGETAQLDGQPLERPAGDQLMCETSGCVKGTWRQSRALSEKNRQAWRHYLECRAVGRWPDDPIVRRNAYIIGGAMQTIQREIDERRNAIRRAGRAAHQ